MEYTPSYRHLIINFSNCNSNILNDSELLTIYTRETVKELNIGKIKNSFFLYNPYGITSIMLLDGGQLTLCTNEENNSVSIHLFTLSRTTESYKAFKYLCKILGAKFCEIKELLPSEANSNLPSADNYKNLRSNFSLDNPIITILGSNGGVANAILSILNNSCEDLNDPIHTFISNCKLNLVDIKQNTIKHYAEKYPNLKNKILLYEFDVNNTILLCEYLNKSDTSIVIDISFGDTVNTLRCCDSLGIVYINSAFESTSVDENEDYEGFPLQERFKIFESHKDEFKNSSAIICSGMNPGVVQWMAIDLMKKYPDKLPKACYIVEEDTSFFEDETKADKDTIYTTWSPECFLDEAIYSYPSFIKNHMSLFFYNEVYEIEFKVTLNDKIFYGCLMPHEEALTLGKMYNIETGFIYKINDHTTNIIKANLDDVDELWNKPMQVLTPDIAPLNGKDLVGVLLVYDDRETFMYNNLDNKETYKKYKTNATYLQVASGLYGALATILLDNIPQGIYYVDELLVNTNSKYGKYLSYHLKEFITGENDHSDGDLINRVREKK